MTKYTKEQAREYLGRAVNNQYDETLRQRCVATINDTLPQYHLDRLTHLRDDYSDELPPEIVQYSSISPETTLTHKCQTTYIVKLESKVRAALEDGVVIGEVKAKAEELLGVGLGFKVGDEKNPDRIVLINSTLDVLIDSFSSEQGYTLPRRIIALMRRLRARM